MRCPNCQSLDTKRNGTTRSAPVSLTGPAKPLQRFLCKQCGVSFTAGRTNARPRAKFSDDVVEEGVRLYIQGLTSYRVLAVMLESRLGVSVSRFTLNNWVLELGGRSKTPLEVSTELRPAWGGFLGIDGKAIDIKGEEHCLLIGVDHPSQDIVHGLVLPAETADGFAQLETEARDAGYPLLGAVSDLGPGFFEAHRDHFSDVPFQACRVHCDRRLDQDIPKAKRSPKAPLNAELKERIRAVLYAPTYDNARLKLDALLAERARFKGIGRADSLGSLARNFELYMKHHFVPGLPPDNNVTENVIKQLNKKLRLMEGFQSRESAEHYARLLIGCYRFKRFTDSVRDEHNGKAPLELAGVDLKGRNWLSFLLNH